MKKPHGEWIDVPIGAEVLAGQNGIPKLKGMHINVHHPDKFKTYTWKAIDMIEKERDAGFCHEQFGWTEDDKGFLFGNVLFALPDKMSQEPVSVQLERKATKLGPTGSEKRWNEVVGFHLNSVSVEHRFAFLCSLASPLMKFLAPNEGGPVVSIYGDSGTGKSTILYAAASIWGAWDVMSIGKVDSFTVKMIKLNDNNNLPVIYDDMLRGSVGINEALELRDFVQMLTDGRERGRGTVQGRMQRDPAHFQTILVSSTNIPLVDTLNRIPGERALQWRIIQLPTQRHDEQTYRGEEYQQAYSATYGHLGTKFLRYLVSERNLAAVKRKLTEWRKVIDEQSHFKGEHRFWSRGLACAYVAAEILQAMPALQDLAFKWSDVVGTIQMLLTDEAHRVQGKPEGEAMALLGAFLTANHKSLIQVDRMGTGGYRIVQEAKDKILIRWDVKSREVTVQCRALDEFMTERGYNRRLIVSQLMQKGVMLDRADISLTHGINLPGAKQPCYIFDGNHPGLGGVAVLEVKKGTKNAV